MSSIRFALAALSIGLAAPLAFAQSTSSVSPPPPTSPTTPPMTSTAPAPMTTPAAPGTTTTKSTTTTTTTSTDASASPAEGACHTRKAVGAKCACLKDPSQIGTAADDPDSDRNWCQVS
jgi:hypothetical protein